MNKYDIYEEITELLDRAVSDLDRDEIDWICNNLMNDLEELKDN